MARSRVVRNRRGQDMAEYAICFAIVLGACVLAQGPVRNRLAAAIENAANNFSTQAASGSTTSWNRQTNAESQAKLDMQQVDTGLVEQNSKSNSYSTF